MPKKPGKHELSRENRELVERLARKLELAESELLDRVLTLFRAYRQSLNLSGRDPEGLISLLKKDKTETNGRGEDLFDRLLLRFYQEHDNLNDFDMLVKELGASGEKRRTGDKET
jgi:hypothetical protein